MVRIKHRYLLVNILYPESSVANSNEIALAKDLPWSVRFRQPTSDKINAKVLIGMIRKSVEELFGDYGSGMMVGSLVVKYFSAATSTAIIRVARAHYRLLWSALSFTTKLPTGQSCVFQVVRVSGTIKKSEEEAIRRARSSILRVQAPSAVQHFQQLSFDTIEDLDMVDANEDDDDDDDPC